MNASAWDILRAVRGPALLITWGTLMALSHTGRIGFDRTWPVLIIVYGLFKLFERMVARPLPMPPPWPAPPQPVYPVGPLVSPAGTYVPPQYPPPPPPTYTPQQPEGGAQ
jgi:hypothetical protein